METQAGCNQRQMLDSTTIYQGLDVTENIAMSKNHCLHMLEIRSLCN